MMATIKGGPDQTGITSHMLQNLLTSTGYPRLCYWSVLLPSFLVGGKLLPGGCIGVILRTRDSFVFKLRCTESAPHDASSTVACLPTKSGSPS